MKKILFIVSIVVFAMVSCKKDNTGASNEICTTAMVYYGGDPNVDGLGWILLTDTAAFKYQVADNLDNQFKIDSLMVDICYIVTDKDFVCFCSTPPQKIVHLTSIKVH
ncbi:MAG: hypothetical protein IPL50_15845 [Chitinophagaceae bacterium]|nr:hypothetical protein [Chitinophagaceae bacterium]